MRGGFDHSSFLQLVYSFSPAEVLKALAAAKEYAARSRGSLCIPKS